MRKNNSVAQPMRKNRSPFVTSEIKELMHKRDSLARRSKSQALTTEEWDQLRMYKRSVTSKMRRLEKEEGKVALLNTDKPSEAWKFINKSMYTTKGQTKLHISPHTLNDFFGTIVTEPSGGPLVLPEFCANFNGFSFHPISEFEVLKALQSLKYCSASGCDGLTSRILKEHACAFSPCLSYLFNLSVNTGVFPRIWKTSNITPVWKGKGSKSNADSYRPISVLPVIGRVFEKLLAKQLYNYCDSWGIIPNNQFGFRSQSSCEHALIKATDSWLREVDKGNMIGALLIDLSKAFDTISHQQLLKELVEIKLDNTAITLLHSYLTERFQRVALGTTTTKWYAADRGVPQGSCLSPLLFNIYVRELPCDDEPGEDTLQYADDATHSVVGSSIEVIGTKLAARFHKTKEFCANHGLTVNTNKTNFIVFKQPSKRIPTDYQLCLDGVNLPPLKEVKLLGFVLDRHLTYSNHISQTACKVRGLLGVLRRACKWLPKGLTLLAYQGLIRSHLEYASALLVGVSNTHSEKLERLQRVAARIICGTSRDAHAEPLLASLGLDDLATRRKDRAIGIVESILNGDCHPALIDLFELASLSDGGIAVQKTRTLAGSRRFSVAGALAYNSRL
mgnify:CR=1 FL=1